MKINHNKSQKLTFINENQKKCSKKQVKRRLFTDAKIVENTA